MRVLRPPHQPAGDMSRTLPSECPHGAIYDWGDFGCDNCAHGELCDGVHNQIEQCGHGCNDEMEASSSV